MSSKFYPPCYLLLYMEQWDEPTKLHSSSEDLTVNDVVEVGDVVIKDVKGVKQPVLQVLGRNLPYYVLIREISVQLCEHSAWWRSAESAYKTAGNGVIEKIKEDLKQYEKPGFVPTKTRPRPYLSLVDT